MKSRNLIFGFIIVVMISSGCASNVNKGQQAYYRKNYDKAIEFFDKYSTMEKTHNDYPIYMLNLATALWAQGNYTRAKQVFDDVSEQIWGPRSTWDSISESGIGLKYKSKRKWIGEQNERLFIRFYTGLLHMLNRNYDEAIVEFKRCADINENYSVVEYMWGLACREIEDENTLLHFNKAKERNENNPYIDLELAYYYALEGDKDEARNIYNKIESQIINNPGVNDFENFTENGTNLLVLIEKHPSSIWFERGFLGIAKEFPPLYVKIKARKYGESKYLDTTANKQSFGDGFKQALAETAGDYLRDSTKEAAASIVPGGGIIVGLLMGGERDPEIATWLLKSPFYNNFSTYLDPGNYEITVEIVTKKGKTIISATKNVRIVGSDLVIIPVLL